MDIQINTDMQRGLDMLRMPDVPKKYSTANSNDPRLVTAPKSGLVQMLNVTATRDHTGKQFIGVFAEDEAQELLDAVPKLKDALTRELVRWCIEYGIVLSQHDIDCMLEMADEAIADETDYCQRVVDGEA